MAIFKGSKSGKAEGGDGNECAIFFADKKEKAYTVRKIMVGDENDIPRIGYTAKGYSELDPYLIKTPEDFQRMDTEPYACYRLESDLVLSPSTYPFNLNVAKNNRQFYGVFDGNGHTLQMEKKGTLNYFFYNNHGTIKNVKLETTTDSSSRYFAYQNYGVIKNCCIKSRIKGSMPLVWSNKESGEIIDCLGYVYKHDETEVKYPEDVNTSHTMFILSSHGTIRNCVTYLNSTGSIGYPSLYAFARDFYKEATVSNCWWATMKGADKTGHYGWDPKDKTQWDIREFDSSLSPIGQVDLDFEKTWYVDENGFLALRGMGPMDFSTNS